MALALGVPTLALIGADSPLRIGPYQVENAHYLYRKDETCDQARCQNQRCADNRCMKAILPEEAFAAVRERFHMFLEGKSAAGREGIQSGV
jgi:ADP-heptose:LPS heptosyltransferase